MPSVIFFVLAAIFFAAGALGANLVLFGNRVNWTDAGLCMLTIGAFLV
jgi:hypothetical protein